MRVFFGLSLAAAVSLSACAMSERAANETGNLENDMLPSAQAAAFQRMDSRLGYDNARIEYGNDNCLLYTGSDNGERKALPLTDASGKQLCAN